MSEQLRAPDFDANQYERPNQDWICGKAAEGQCCRTGPDSHGRCRATFECRPVLDLKEGETKGRYRCTRPAEYGGPCECGPLPDGTCSRAIPKCQPIRSLRNKRKVFTRAVVMTTVAGLLALGGPYRARFINPGPLSAQHSSDAFAKMHGKGDMAGCAACHRTAEAGPSRWLASAATADPAIFDFPKLFSVTNDAAMQAIDESCEKCHQHHNFHEPEVVRAYSCSACHREHLGSGQMHHPEDANCVSCHGNAQLMETFAAKGTELLKASPAIFELRPDNGRALFKAPRPERGYTQTIHAFAKDHPEFQVLAEKLRDPDTLKFNHQLHLSSPTVPTVNGHKLECADCHKPDATGMYYRPVSYEQNCKACHSLLFDEKNPGLSVPHGNAEFARAFLRSLPAQYADYARKQGLTTKGDIDEFVKAQMRRLRTEIQGGENLEQKVFFSDARTGPVQKIAGEEKPVPAKFAGCAYCHEVKPADNDAAPVITHPILIDRWLAHGQFDHSKHLALACAHCHDAASSRDTADVILPSRATCVECHSPKGGVANDCSTCHSYHTPGGGVTVTANK